MDGHLRKILVAPRILWLEISTHFHYHKLLILSFRHTTGNESKGQSLPVPVGALGSSGSAEC